MGELSKKVGEDGEKKALKFFDLIGWEEERIINGVDLPCVNSSVHKLPTSENERQSHGVDLIYSYVCSYDPDVKKQVLISVKNTVFIY